jgi:hypothetical protein
MVAADPGVGGAISADLQNAELIGALGSLGAKVSPIQTTAEPNVIAQEITERIGEEFDYRIEAANQIRFCDHYEATLDAFGPYGDVVRGMGISREAKDFLFLMRIQIGLYSVLGALNATGDWRAMQAEMLGDAEPQTEVGRRHRAWKSNRTDPSTPT